jgi:hypothetical protein
MTMSIRVTRYTEELRPTWEKALSAAKNGLFLFSRDYISYHGDKFEDFSCVAYLDETPVAIMPATLDRETMTAISHPGLTFGGVVLDRNIRGPEAISVINECFDALKLWGAKTLIVKPVPYFLCTYPAGELNYVLWMRGFELYRKDLSSIMPLCSSRIGLNSLKKRGIAKASKANLVVGEGCLKMFHALLSENLTERHGVAPVHSPAELLLLKQRFDDKIFLRSITHEGEMLAGTLIYRYPTAWHTQYLTSSEEGRSKGALDKVIFHVISESADAGVSWLSLGRSTESEGRLINEGLLWQKESFGARSITLDFWRGAL